MIETSNKTNIPEEIITSKIYFIRDQKIMLDSDLAKLYGVETRRLNEQIKRNIERFPIDFMFRLTSEEWLNLKSQFATSSWGGRRKPPLVFTEQGVAMLSSVLNSKTAIKVNIQIIRIFTKMKSFLLTQKNLIVKLKEIEEKVSSHDEQMLLIFEYIKQFENTKQQLLENKERIKIGYKK
jgi:phage regulator Rha-like protein